MQYSSNLHPKAHFVKSCIGNFVVPFTEKEKGQLIVLNYHGTQKKFLYNFKEQLNYYADHFEIINARDFVQQLSQGEQLKNKKLMLTFDDGIKNNLYAVEELEKRNISAYFFVVPGFVECEKEKQKEYFIKNIRPNINLHIDSLEEDFESMSWEDLKLISQKHIIGCHTYTHSLTACEKSPNALKHEILDSKNEIEGRLGKSIHSFCSINNTLLSVNNEAKQLIDTNYDLHFTTFGGINQPLLQKQIQRINVESHWLMGAVKFALSKFETNRWKTKIEEYNRL